MTKLYTKLAALYHEMYKSIFDYDEDFQVAHRILRTSSVKRILELGCGAGNLAARFQEAGYDYVGMDSAEPMLQIARNENPKAKFIRGDMRNFSVRKKFDAVLIGGRSFSYMVSNADVIKTLRSVRRALRPKGVLILDNFDAELIFQDMSRPLRDKVRSNGRTVTRVSKRTINLNTGWTWNWDAEYVVDEKGRRRRFRDRTILRAFTGDEINLFLSLAGFTAVRSRKHGAVILTVAEA
jgi:SAM-dependent methyltransferase